MSDILTKYTDYSIFVPDFFIDFIADELLLRDLGEITNNRIKAINVSGDHPLVQLTGSIMQSGKPNFAGLLPAISVIDENEMEENTTMGQGKRSFQYMDIETIQNIKNNFREMKNRVQEGVISDNQIAIIEAELGKIQNDNEHLIIEVEEFYNLETIFVSLWTHTTHERQVIGSVLRSILFDMKKVMMKKGLFDFSMKTTKGLVNYNFGQLIFGQESEITYRHSIRNYTVYKLGIIPDKVDVSGTYKEFSPSDKSVTIYE